MTKAWPAIVRLAVRDVVAVLAAAVNDTDPLPLPFAPLVIETQLAVVVAVHAQFDPAVTLTLPLAPDAGTEALVADSV